MLIDVNECGFLIGTHLLLPLPKAARGLERHTHVKVNNS